MKKISVCVPTYNRPETLRQLIYSYQRQKVELKELIISDDTQSTVIKDVIDSFKDSSIRYFHNPKSLRFAGNLRASLERATGDYLFILGDDDILLSENTLSTYREVFETNPSVGFVYCNSVQFSDALRVEYIIRHFEKDELFSKGEDAMRRIWTRSIFIGGIGLRNNNKLLTYFPKKSFLHPQVEFIGNIINTADAFGIADHLIGMRSHEDQIIFHALRNKEIRQQGAHVTVELYEFFKLLKKKYSLKLQSDFLMEQLINEYIIMLFKEKRVLGSQAMEENYQTFLSLYPSAIQSIKLQRGHALARLLPSVVIPFIRSSAIHAHVLRNKAEVDRYQRQLKMMIARL